MTLYFPLSNKIPEVTVPQTSSYHGIVINPPHKVRASQIFSRGFIISQNFWNVSFGVLLFSENFADFGHFSDTFWIIFEAFPPCKTAKSAQFFRARVARGDSLLTRILKRF